MFDSDYIYKLYFINSNGERRCIDSYLESMNSFKEIKKFCDDRNYKIPYIRSWMGENEESGNEIKVYDVGSHTEFFEIEKHGKCSICLKTFEDCDCAKNGIR